MALTRKNALFAGHEVGAENWAFLASIVATCKLNSVNPAAMALSDSVKPCSIGDRGEPVQNEFGITGSPPPSRASPALG